MSSKQGMMKLEQLQAQFEQHHDEFKDQIERLLEDLDDSWQEELQTTVQRLISSHACDNPSMATELIDSKCRLLAQSQLSEKKEELTALQAGLRVAREELVVKTESLLKVMQQLERSVTTADSKFQQAQADVQKALYSIAYDLNRQRGSIEETVNENIDKLRQAGSQEQLAQVTTLLHVRCPLAHGRVPLTLGYYRPRCRTLRL